MPPRFFTEDEIVKLFSKSSKEDIKDIMADANAMIEALDRGIKRKRKKNDKDDDDSDTLSFEDKARIKAIIAEYAKSSAAPYDINTKKMNREDVARARLIKHHMDNYKKMTSEEFDAELEKPLRYADGTIKSLKDDFGDFDRNESDADIGVFKKGKQANLTFRGSRLPNYFAPRVDALKDWLYNAKGLLVSQKDSPEYQNALTRSRKIAQDFDVHINGFSKGGGKGFSVGEDLHQEGFKVKTTSFNPHINNTHIPVMHEFTGDHTIFRTPGDPASITLGVAGKSPDTKLKVVPPLKNADWALREHNLANFYDDVSERNNRVNFVEELQAHKGLVDMHNELVHADNLLRNPKKLAIHAAKKIGLLAKGKRPKGVFLPDEEGQELTSTRRQSVEDVEDPRAAGRRALTTTRDLEPQVPLRPEQRLSGARDESRLTSRRALRTTSDTRAIETFEIEQLNSSADTPSNVSQSKPLTRIQKAMIGQLEEGVIERGRGKIMEILRGVRGSKEPVTDRNFRLVNEKLGDSSPLSSTRVQQALLEADPEAPGGMINEKTMRKFINSDTRVRQNVITKFRERVNSHANTINDKYLTPYKRASGLAGLPNAKTLLTTGVAGTAAGALATVAMDKLGINKDLNPEAATFVTGSVAGAAGEVAAMKAAGMLAKSSPKISSDIATALLSKAGASRILTGGLSAGVGALAGYEATEAIRGDFSKDADPYVKNITAEVAGGVIGTGASVVTGAALTAAYAFSQGGLEAASASIEFPPLALAFLIGSGISVIAGSIIGSQEAAQEEQEKAEKAREISMQKKVDKRLEREDIKSQRRIEKSANILSLNEQYDKMIDYLKSIGASNETISKAQQDLLNKVTNKSKPLNENQYQNQMEKYLGEFNVKDPNREDLQNTLATQFQVRASRMTFLINKLNQAGYDVPVPSSNAYVDTENYTAAYNEILASIPSSERKKLGLDYLPDVYKEDFKDKIVNPDDLSTRQRESLEKLEEEERARDKEIFYENHPSLAERDGYDNTQETYTQPTGPSLEAGIEEQLEETGESISEAFDTATDALSSVGADIGSGIKTAASGIANIFTPQNVPKATSQVVAQQQAKTNQVLANPFRSGFASILTPTPQQTTTPQQTNTTQQTTTTTTTQPTQPSQPSSNSTSSKNPPKQKKQPGLNPAFKIF